MEIKHTYKYYVVQFLEKPYSTIDLEVCVPYGWMKVDENTNPKTSAAYPTKYSPSIRESVRKDFPIREEWCFYKVKVQYGNDSFTKAEKYIKSRTTTEPQRNECSNTEINENKSATKRKPHTMNQRSSPDPAIKKNDTKDLLLKNNRSVSIKLSTQQPILTISTIETSESMSKRPNHSNESPKKEQEQHDTTEVEMSTVTNNSTDQTVLESGAENETSSILPSQSRQPLTSNNKENFPIHSPNQKSQVVDMKKNDKLDPIHERSNCQNSSTSGATEYSIKSAGKPDKPSKRKYEQDPRFLPFLNYAHSISLKQKLLKLESNKMHGMRSSNRPPINTINTTVQNSTYQSRYLSDQSHQHQYPATLHNNSQSQNLPEPNSAKVKSNVEEKNTALRYSNHFLMLNKHILNQRNKSVGRPMHALNKYNCGLQQISPNMATMSTPSDLNHLHFPRLSMHTNQEPRAKEILNRSTGVKPTYQSGHSQSTTHQDPYTQGFLHRSTDVNPTDHNAHIQSAMHQEPCTQKVLHRSAEANPIDQRASSLKAKHQEPPTQEILHKPTQANAIDQRACSASATNQEPRTQIVIDKSTKVNPIEQSNSSQSTLRKEIKLNTLKSNVKVMPNMSIQVIQDQSTSELRNQERCTGKPPKLNHTEKSINMKNNTNNESSSAQSTPITSQSIKQSCKNKLSLSPVSKHSLNQEMPTQEITVEKNTEENHIDPNTCPENNRCLESTLNTNVFTTINALPVVSLIVEQSLLKIIQNIIEQTQLTITNQFLVNINYNNTTSVQFDEAIKEILKAIDRYFELVNKEKIGNNKNKKSNNLTHNYIANDNDDNNGNDDSGGDSKNKDGNENNDDYYEPPTKKRGSKITFLLPQEYDQHDSRWTLKYQKIEPGVVELMPSREIYINNLKFNDCKRAANNYEAFGQMLLSEIFSRNALSVCSLKDTKNNYVRGLDIRPGLDKTAISTLTTYVMHYGHTQGWGPFDMNSFENSLRRKILEVRSKYGVTGIRS
ncbi:uncharacterized protein [Epargyreus clarus]|uniref:uncharacterized protein n=1 Tax=Epargyreus clarus TaxID=520877 RepID=UPI003C2FD8D0